MAEATARAGMVAGLAQLAAVPVFGIIGDRVDKLTLLILEFLISTVGYSWVASLDDVLSPMALPALFCMGMGLSGAQLGSTVLLAQEAPVQIRGSANGLQSFCGGIGILALSAGGGRLYDAFGPQAPFMAVAIANGAVLARNCLAHRGGEGESAGWTGFRGSYFYGVVRFWLFSHLFCVFSLFHSSEWACQINLNKDNVGSRRKIP